MKTGTTNVAGYTYISETEMIDYDGVDESLREEGVWSNANRGETINSIINMMREQTVQHTTMFGLTLTQEFDSDTGMAHILDENRIVLASCHYNE